MSLLVHFERNQFIANVLHLLSDNADEMISLDNKRKRTAVPSYQRNKMNDKVAIHRKDGESTSTSGAVDSKLKVTSAPTYSLEQIQNMMYLCGQRNARWIHTHARTHTYGRTHPSLTTHTDRHHIICLVWWVLRYTNTPQVI